MAKRWPLLTPKQNVKKGGELVQHMAIHFVTNKFPQRLHAEPQHFDFRILETMSAFQSAG